MRRAILALGVVAWFASAGTGLALLWDYSSTPGSQGAASERWPESAAMRPAAAGPTVVVFLHPRCPCSRATVGELGRVAAAGRGAADIRVAFFQPVGADPSWSRTDLWREAAAIPGVTVSCDESGVEASRFGAETSGQVLLYGAGGGLLFRGGITGARGHSGDNVGRDALVALLAKDESRDARSPVYGCPLSDPSECEDKESPHVSTVP
jgi:hypothetical protein